MQKSQNLLAIIPKICLAVLMAFVFVASPALAETDSNQQKMQYDVYAGGIHALQANLDIDRSEKGRYAIELQAKTYGLLGKLAPWEGTFFSKGWAKEGANKPQLHSSTAIWRKEAELKKYHYKKDGSFKEYTLKDDSNDGSPKKVDDELTQGTSDVLTATLNTMEAVAKGQECSGKTDIFDGKRRYSLVFKQKKEVVLESSRWNVYAGPAIECTVEVVPGAGKWYEKPRGWMSIQEQGRERGKIPTVWLAQITEGQPAVPVKVRVKTSYGTLFMHMTSYETENNTLTLPKK